MTAARLDDSPRILALLRAHGDATTSFQALERGLVHWFHEDGCVAYVDTGSARVAAGPPIAPRASRADLARRFIAASEREGRRACFFGVDRAFAEQAGLRSLLIGEEPHWDLVDDPWRGRRRVREQLRRARAKGVRVRVVDPRDLAPGTPTRAAMEALIDRWLATRPLAAMGFLVDVQPFDHAEERIVVVAERSGELVAFAAAVPVYKQRGFFLEDLIRDPHAPNGTAELLIDAFFRAARARGATTATLGLAALAGPVAAPLALARRATSRLYNFEGVRSFRARLHPARWEPVFLAHPRNVPWPAAVRDALSAFATGGFLRFGAASLRRQRRVVALVLGTLLLPWAVAVASGAPFFPSRAVQVAWVLFDVALACALIALFRKWRAAVATALALVTALDALLTLTQVAAWNAQRIDSPAAALLLLVAVIAPTAASAFLFWAGRLSLESS